MDKFKTIEYILPCHFLASVEIYTLYYSGQCIWEAHENYQKRSTRNRTRFNSDRGPITFSIPLKAGKNNQLPIRQVEISYEEDWVKSLNHLLRSNYGSTPYIDHYLPGLISILNSNQKYLWDLNQALHLYLCSKLDIESNVLTTYSWQRSTDNKFIDFRSELNINKELKYYPQIHKTNKDFQTNLSVLDLLFNCGPESHIYLSDPFKKRS